MAEAKYSAGLMSQSFWFIEFKKIVKHTNDGKSIDEIRALCLEDNLLGISKAYRAKRIYGYIINRVRTLDSTSIKLFCDSDLHLIPPLSAGPAEPCSCTAQTRRTDS